MVRTRSGRHTTPKKKKEEKSRNQDVAEDDDWEALCEDGNSANLAIGGVTPCRWARWECLTCDLRQVGEGGLTFEEHCKTDFHRTNECRRLLQLHKTALFRPRGGLEVTLSSGGSDPSDPIKTVPESKVKTTLFLSNKSTQNSVKIEEFDLLFGIPGLTFKRKDTETDRVKTDVNVIRPGEQCAYELTFKPTSIGITEAIFVVKCQSSEGETENEEEKENEKKKKKKNSNNKNKHGATCQVFATRWCCETVHPKYKGELALLSSQSPSSGILKSPTKKKMNMREQMAKRRAEDLDNLSKIIFNEENIVNSGFRVPGEYRRLASFVDEAVRFEMLEGLEHPGVVQQGLAHSFDRKGGIQSELENYNDYWHRVLWMEEVLKEKDVKKFDLRNVRIQMLEEKEEVDVDNVLFRVAFPSHDDDTGAGNHPLKGVERAAVESVADGETAVALVTALRDDHLVLKVGNDFLEPKRQQGKFNIRFVLGRVVLERFHEAIHFATNDRRGIELLLRWFLHKKTNMSSRLAAAVPTHDLEVIGGTALNQRQQLAVQCALTFSGPTVPAAANHPYVIFGPPGTGKTTTLVEYILQVLQQEHTTQGQITGKSYRVLVTAPSNSAADNIAMQLLNHVDPTVILRVNASSREIDSLPDELGAICLTKAGKFRRPNWNEITGAKILVMTCCSAANLRKKYSNLCLQHNTFTHCVIDEAGQATEPETLCSVMGLLTRESALILGGDPQQLRPVVLTSFGGRKDGLGLTLLERLTDGDIAPSSPFAVDSHGQTNVEYTTMLVENYRSHESIIKAPNETLYYGELIAKGDQKIVKLHKSQSNSCAILWHGIVAKERREQGNPSFFNPFEIIQVLDYCLRIHREKKVPQEEIGVITPYKKQQLKILRLLKAKGLEEIEVGTVELFQGREKRVIVACCCRSKPVYLDLNKRKDLGFLTDFRRWNVTVTRAKELLVVVANPDLMVHDPYWRDLLHLCACSGNCMGFKPEEIHSSSETFQRAFLHRLERLGLGSVADIHSHVLRIKLDTLLEKDMKKTKSKKSGRKKKEREKQQLVLAAMLNLSPANLVCLCGKKFVEKSNHHYVKDQGGMQHFIQSYGLKPTPDGFDQGNAIIDAIRAIERESFLQEHKHCHLTHTVQEPAFEPLDL